MGRETTFTSAASSLVAASHFRDLVVVISVPVMGGIAAMPHWPIASRSRQWRVQKAAAWASLAGIPAANLEAPTSGVLSGTSRCKVGAFT